MITENETTEIPANEGGDLDFTNLKKKKRRVIDAEVAGLEANLKEARIPDDRGRQPWEAIRLTWRMTLTKSLSKRKTMKRTRGSKVTEITTMNRDP